MGRISIRNLIRTVEVPDEVETYVLELRHESRTSTSFLREATELLRVQAVVEYTVNQKPAEDILALLERIDKHFED